MKTTMKLIPVLFGIMLFFTQCEKEAVEMGNKSSEAVMLELKDAHEGCEVVQTLWAGAGQNNTDNGTDVGSVTATVVGDQLVVVYETTGFWNMTTAHLWVGKDKTKVPKNAAPGRFPFKEDLDFENFAEFVIDLADLDIFPGDPIYLAAHADVVNYVTDLDAFGELLPEVVDFHVIYFKKFADYGIATPPQSYFQTNITGEFLMGSYKGWCVDTQTPMALETPLTGTAYSSYGMLPDGLFDYPQNWPYINWIINNIFVGEASMGGFGNFTMGDFQRAFWTLLEEDPNLNVPGGVGSYSDDRVAEIIERALANGEAFVPGCGEEFAIVIVVPGKQTTFFHFPVPCGGGSETAWAFGEYTFIELGIAKKWGWVFELLCY